MNGPLEIARSIVGGHCQCGGNEPLHIAGTAPEKLAVPLDHAEGIAAPVLIRNRDHVGMARQDDTPLTLRSNGGEQIGLGSAIVVKQIHARSDICQSVGHVVDHGKVAVG